MFPQAYLDQLVAALPILEVVSRRHKMRREGSEWRAEDNHSLVVNPKKGVWSDFGAGGTRGGNVISFWMFDTGCTFVDAVIDLSKIAGMTPPGPVRRQERSNGPGGHSPTGAGEKRTETARKGGNGHAGGGPTKREIVATYPYLDADGAEIYQVVRWEWFEEGQKRKSFSQRRLVNSKWAWGISEGVYLRGGNGELYVATKERLKSERWANAESVRLEAVAHGLYRFPELLVELAEEPAERRVVFLPEGEKDCDTLAAWGLVATTNSGGAGNWRVDHADWFKDCDVVVLLDNDQAGRERGALICAALHTVAARVRLLAWPEHWPGCPEGGDVTDWVARGNGDKAKFCEILIRLRDWAPEIPDSMFGATRFIDVDKKGPELEWLIKGVLTRGEVSIWFGQWGSGKSFLITDAALAVARAIPWFGHRVMPGLVIYQAGEGGLGFRKRLRAYRQFYRLDRGEDVPFVLLPSRLDIFGSDADADRLVAEVRAWGRFYSQWQMQLLVLDTLNAAAPGADENASRDMGPVLNRARRIAGECQCHVALVDHTPKDGATVRGWSGKMGNVDNVVAITLADAKHVCDDGVARPLRQWKVIKQKDEASDVGGTFVLRGLEIGHDNDLEPLTSCVVEAVDGAAADIIGRVKPADWYEPHAANLEVLRCLERALREHGDQERPVPEPACTIRQWQDTLVALQMGHEVITPQVRDRLRQRIARAAKAWDKAQPGAAGLIFKQGEWVWRSGRKVWGVDQAPKPVVRPKPEPDPIVAPGEDPRDLWELSNTAK